MAKTCGGAPNWFSSARPTIRSGSVLQLDDWKELFTLQDKYGFTIASDECYSKSISTAKNPSAALKRRTNSDAATKAGHVYQPVETFQRPRPAFQLCGRRCGNPEPLPALPHLPRSAMGIPVQHASIAAWNDEQHVVENRRLYQESSTAYCQSCNRRSTSNVPTPRSTSG